MTKDESIIFDKELRLRLETELQALRGAPPSIERGEAVKKLMEARHWLGEDLRRLNDGESCYKRGNDVRTTAIDPAADVPKVFQTEPFGFDNARRAVLLEREESGTLTVQERKELELLNEAADAWLTRNAFNGGVNL